jgi:RNA polymerase sigma-70 factor (TIGR02952 family)
VVRSPHSDREDGLDPPSRYPATDAAAEVWQLVEQAQAGVDGAFGEIYDRYVDTVFRSIYFRVGNRELAEDLTSETFLRALKRIGSFTWQGRDLGAWLITIARNLVADHFKSGRYRLEVTTGDALAGEGEDPAAEGNPEAAVVDHITNVALLNAVKQLNPEQRQCVTLRFLQGFSVAETAQAMDRNEGAIKALQYRAVRALARLLPEGFHLNQPVTPQHPNAPHTDATDIPTSTAPMRVSVVPVDVASDTADDNISVRVQALTDRQRTVYTMIVEEGKTVAEIARLIGLKPSTVRVHLSRANKAVTSPPRRTQARPAPQRRYIATDFSQMDTSPASLMRLPKGQRDVVRRFVGGASREQIADERQSKVATVRSQLCKAMKTLGSDDRGAPDG